MMLLRPTIARNVQHLLVSVPCRVHLRRRHLVLTVLPILVSDDFGLSALRQSVVSETQLLLNYLRFDVAA